ncbi:MAG: Nif3-like dinuclear metal center hexameric protein [Acutalibacteraceae bacterium]|nr:Nif3-like dinuclear metal center hexameric protein [Acutalibacteraceae bacterium]
MNIRLFDLDNRLALCADFVRNGSRVADIGTDHAYLPVWLCKNNIAKNAIAADINPAPLQHGIQTIEKYNAQDMVTTCLSNGLEKINPNDIDDIIIAGMGGELIVSILNNAPWIKDSKYHLILQPMTKAEILREYLYNNSFDIECEKTALAENKLYTVMSVFYTGIVEGNTRLRKYYGKINPMESRNNYEYIIKVANSLIKKGNAIEKAYPHNNSAKKFITNGNALLKYAETSKEEKIITVKDIYNYIDSFAPFETAMSFDNAGLLMGDETAQIKKVLVALDITEDVLNEAHSMGAELVISHHPVIFKPLKSINSNSIPYKIAQLNLSAICAHTNLDLSSEGVNVCLANTLELENILLTDEGIVIGELPANSNKLTSKQFAELVKNKLDCNGVRYTDIKNSISRVAVGGGACGEYIYLAKNLGADAFVTGEIKHNYILESHDINLTVVDAGHYKTEDVVIDFLVEKLSKKFPDIVFIKSKKFTDYISYI